MTFVFRIR